MLSVVLDAARGLAALVVSDGQTMDVVSWCVEQPDVRACFGIHLLRYIKSHLGLLLSFLVDL